jgi:alpha-L-rhamnosidase
MVLAGVIEGEDAKNALLDVLDCQESVKPFTPYMHHYVLEAMFKLGLDEMAFDYMKDFWGKMADLGADTFFEAFVPDDPDFSPYNDRMINSMCHAWSCTPTYFIRKYAKQ